MKPLADGQVVHCVHCEWEVTRIAKRMEDVRAASAISRADFYRVMTGMGRVVDLVVTDGEQRERIHDGWMEIRLA